MPSSHLILCHSLLLLPPISPSIRVFSNEATLRMRWPKYWRFRCLASRGPVWRCPVPRVKRTTVSLELLCRRVFALPGPLPEGSPPPQVFVQKSPSQWGRLWSLHLQPSCLPSLLYFLTVIYHHLRRWVLPGFCFWASACPH